MVHGVGWNASTTVFDGEDQIAVSEATLQLHPTAPRRRFESIQREIHHQLAEAAFVPSNDGVFWAAAFESNSAPFGIVHQQGANLLDDNGQLDWLRHELGRPRELKKVFQHMIEPANLLANQRQGLEEMFLNVVGQTRDTPLQNGELKCSRVQRIADFV